MDYKNIKFRAWHKDKERMYNILELDFSGNLVLLDYYFVTTPHGVVQESPFWEPVDEVELMMYTGQQDKHGKDIYEGDVVSTTILEEYATYNQTREITYMATTIDTENYGSPDISVVYSDVKIIGNKYENPELV